MSSVPEFSSMSVHQAEGHEFGLRLVEPPSFRMLGDVTDNAASYNMRTLATAIRLLSQTPKCKRLLVPVEMKTLDLFGAEYARMLLTIPDEYRSKMFLELSTEDMPITDATAAFSMHIQNEVGMSVAVWTKCCDVPYLNELMDNLQPAILGMDRRCVRQAVDTGDRSFMLDAVEIGIAGGARVLVEGVDSEADLRSMKEIQVDLVCGRAVSEVKVQLAGEYSKNVALMSAHERRQRAKSS